MNKIQAAEQMRRALQMFCMSLEEEQALEIPAVYDVWTPGRTYKTGEYLTYGKNGVGDPQLYKAAQEHTAQIGWEPGTVPALYTAVGLDSGGYPVWARPTGAHDAYNTGDIVNFEGELYRSLIDGNAYSPAEYPASWEKVDG